MTNITKAAQQALEALESLVHNTPYDGRYSDAIIHLRAALQDKAVEVPADFVPRLMAAVRIYQQQDYQAQEDASIADVSELYRAVCRIVGPSQPAPVVPDDVDPLQGAANWIVEATDYDPTTHVAEIQQRLLIGYNRASRLYVAVMLAASQQKGGQRC